MILARSATRMKKFARLVAAVDNWPRALLDHLELRSASYSCRLRDGTTIEVRGGTDDRHTVFEVFAERIYPLPSQPAGVVLDVGAHIGCFTTLAARLGYQVVGFEPSPDNFAILQRNVRRNGLSRVQLINAAVGERRRTGRLVLPDDHAHTGRFSLFPGRGTRTLPVPVVTLGDVVRAGGFERIALLKLDCQGSEYEILYSTEDGVLQRIDAIIAECERFPSPPEWSLEGLQRFLDGKGFRTSTRANILYANRAADW